MRSLIAVIALLWCARSTASAQVSLTGQASPSGSAQLVNTPPVPASFFGMIVGTPTDMPALVPFGQFRFWDDGASWPLIEKSGPTPRIPIRSVG